jgi:hypothetical protein
MSVIFQLFCAEDLKQLTEPQLTELKRIVGDEVRRTEDTLLESSQMISRHIQDSHMQKLRLLPSSPRRAVNISQARAIARAIAIPGGGIDVLRKRVHEVFEQLTGQRPSGPSSSPVSPAQTLGQLLDQLLSPEDFSELKNRVGDKGPEILAWALTCELANYKTYEAFEQIKQKADEAFMNFMQANGRGAQRPIGPDTPYSPFYPGSALYHYRSGPNP